MIMRDVCNLRFLNSSNVRIARENFGIDSWQSLSWSLMDSAKRTTSFGSDYFVPNSQLMARVKSP